MSSPLENLETQLELFIENVRQVRIIVSDFQPQGHNVLNQKMYANELLYVFFRSFHYINREILRLNLYLLLIIPIYLQTRNGYRTPGNR